MSTAHEDPQVRLVVLDHPLQEGPRTRHDSTVTIAPGVRLCDVLPERVTAEPGWIVVEHGRVIPQDEWVAHVARPGAEIVCYRKVHGAVGRIIAGALLVLAGAAVIYLSGGTLAPATWSMWGVGLGMMGLGTMAGGIADLVIGQQAVPMLTQSSSESTPTYGFGGIRNSLRMGAPIPVVYGEHRVGGQIIQIVSRAEQTLLNSTGTGTISITYASTRGSSWLASAVSDEWMRVVGAGTQFLSALHPGDRIRCAGYEFTVRGVSSDTELSVHYTGQPNIPAGSGWSHIRNTAASGDNEILSMVLALSEGPIQAISDLRIDDQPVANYRGVSVETTTGTATDSALAGFSDSSTVQTPADAAITTSWLTYTTNGKRLTAIELHIQFPQGLYAVSDDGGLQQATVDLTVEYRTAGVGGWTNFGTISISDAKRSVLRRNIRIEGLTPRQYDVRISRATEESTSLRRVDAVRRAAVSEIVNDAYIYPYVAKLAVRALATDQLSGRLPTVTALVQGVKVKVFVSAAGFNVAWTRSPAWIVFDMLTNTRYGMGRFVWPIVHSGTWSFTNGSATVTGSGFSGTVKKGQKIVVWTSTTIGLLYTVSVVSSDTQLILTSTFTGTTGSYLSEAHRNDLDIQAFIDWAAFCAEEIADPTDFGRPRAVCDVVFDQQGNSVWDAANKVCGLGYASLVKLGNYITVKFQRAEASVQLFTMGNIVAGTFKESFLPLDQRANTFEVGFLNRDNDYEQEMITLEDPLLYTNSEQPRKQTVQVYGVTKSSQAASLARFYQLSSRYMTRLVEWEAGIDAVAAEPGDVIEFQHDVPQWGFGGRVGTGSGLATVVLDQPVTVESGKAYQVRVRMANDSIQTRTVTNAPGSHTTLTVGSNWSGVILPTKGDIWAFGETGVVTKPYRLISVERTPEFNVRLTAVEYNAAVYDETGAAPVNVVQYSSLPNLSGPPPHVSDLAIVQLTNDSVLVTFSPPSDPRYKTTYLYRMQDGRPLLVGESRDGNAVIGGLSPGELVVIRAVAVSQAGVQANLYEAPLAVWNVVQRELPPNVTGLELFEQGHDTAFVGRDAKFQWRRASIDGGVGIDSFGRERLGIGADGRAVSLFKNYRVEIYNTDGITLRRREYVTDPFYTYTYEKNYEDAQRLGLATARTFTIKVWTQDIYTQLSARPAALTVANVAPAAVSNLSAVATATGALVSWSRSTEPDLAGYLVHRSSVSSGFTPDASNQIYDGPSTVYVDDNLTIGTTYYYKVAAYDTFDEAGLDYGGAVNATPAGVAQSQLIPGLRAVDVVAVLPTLPSAAYPQGAIVFLTTDNQLYRSTGATWTVAVPASEIAGQLTDAQLAAIAAAKVTGQLTDAQLAAIAAAKITGQITTTQITDGSISTAKLSAGAVTANELAANSVISGKIAAGAVATTELAATSVTSAKVAAGAITAGKIAVDAITAAGAEIANATISTAKIIDAAVTTAKIADANITTAKIADANITTAKIADANITTAKIADGNITTAKIGDANITTAKISDANITTAKIGDLNVTTIKIASNAVTNRAESRGVGESTLTYGSSSWVDLASVSFVSNGGSVLVMGRLYCRSAGAATINFRLVRDSTELEIVTVANDLSETSFREFLALIDLDAPSAGTYTYKLQGAHVSSEYDSYCGARGIWVTEYLK